MQSEIRIIMVAAYCLWKLGDTSGLSGQLEQLGSYILHHCTDTEEQAKVYPHCAWLLGQLYLGKIRWRMHMSYVEKEKNPS